MSGFSLLEMLVVLAVLGLVAAAALPRAASPPDRTILQASAIDIGTSLRRLRAAALRTNSEQALMIDSMRRTFWTTLDERTRHLSGTEVSVSGSGILERGGNVSAIRFRPDGSACDARVVLRRGQRQVDIIVDWLSGSARLDWRL